MRGGWTRSKRGISPNLAITPAGIIWVGLPILLILGFQCFAQAVLTVAPGAKTINLEGSVWTGDAATPSYVEGAKVEASGRVTVETETDNTGSFAFEYLPPGAYTVTASVSGLEEKQVVTLQAGQVLKLSLQLTPTVVVTSVNVTAPESVAESPAPTQAITEKTLRDAPNMNERMENLLPLVPGVVRGPDGRINMKGARNTQSGALVNSANVSDPVTGSSAMNFRSTWSSQCRSSRILMTRSTAGLPGRSRVSKQRLEATRNSTTRSRTYFRGGGSGEATSLGLALLLRG